MKPIKQIMIVLMFVAGLWFVAYGIGLAGYHCCKWTVDAFCDAIEENNTHYKVK